MTSRTSTASRAVALSTAASLIFANVAGAQPAPSPAAPVAQPAVIGMLHYYKSDFRLNGRIGTTSYSWTVPAQSMEQCRILAEAARRAQSPGIDGGICMDTSNGIALKLELQRGAFRLVP